MARRTVLILKASPRAKGNSSILADRLADGARAAGAATETFCLHDMHIQPCDACDSCQQMGDYQCVIRDDMQLIYPVLKDAHAIVIASPVYWFTMSAQAKLCIDRWYALQGSHGNALEGKQMAFILTYGDSDPYTSGAINAIRTYQDMCRYVHAPIAGIVYGTASDEGDVAKQPDLLDAAYKLGQKLGAGA